ncbi:MAG: helix-hairpin-helix domain-containing protein, partial [Candidatus Heimdallarchaeaceae archaeon]
KPEVKASPKPEVKAAPKDAPKPVAKKDEPKPKPEVKAAPKPEVKAAPKDAPKPVAKKEDPKPKPEVTEEKPKAPAKPKAVKVDVSEIKGVGAKTAMLLKESGFDTVNKIATSSDEDLSKVPGIGPATAKAMISEAKNLLAKAKEDSK